MKHYDTGHSRVFYYNSVTDKSTWIQPDAFLEDRPSSQRLDQEAVLAQTKANRERLVDDVVTAEQPYELFNFQLFF